ncbi:hypothetical protein [Eubacterium ramulus]|uniref:hypothetical protein n=1 Tax=Eubacterium ramulus TaxID=39490 RepID=UPI00351FA7AC
MNIEDQLSLIEDFKVLLRRAMIYAKHSHDFIFDDSVDNSTALFYLNVAASKFAAAESLYYSRINELESIEAKEIFQLFEVYMKEALTNYRTNHSHQWSDIEFNRLKEAFAYSPFAFENK